MVGAECSGSGRLGRHSPLEAGGSSTCTGGEWCLNGQLHRSIKVCGVPLPAGTWWQDDVLTTEHPPPAQPPGHAASNYLRTKALAVLAIHHWYTSIKYECVWWPCCGRPQLHVASYESVTSDLEWVKVMHPCPASLISGTGLLCSGYWSDLCSTCSFNGQCKMEVLESDCPETELWLCKHQKLLKGSLYGMQSRNLHIWWMHLSCECSHQVRKLWRMTATSACWDTFQPCVSSKAPISQLQKY